MVDFETVRDEKITYGSWPCAPAVSAIGRFVFGLMHDNSHLSQIAEIVRQAQAARA